MSDARPFLTARWTNLVVANFEIPKEALASMTPRGTTLDTFEGRALVSVVAFMFEDTKLFGALPAPPSPTFEEINLRFYVKRVVDGVARRGVCFVREVVPSRLVAWVARTVYEEPYERHVTDSSWTFHDAADRSAGGTFAYGWRAGDTRLGVRATTEGPLSPLAPGSEAEFIFEHYWGYTQRHDGTTSEYEVTHPPWRAWAVSRFEMEGDIGAFYGGPFVGALSKPRSVFVAAGSEIGVLGGHRLE
jgi:uncharacterized protein YqjF (DUF2071 family)